MRRLILGGARSGKSSHAERLLAASPAVTYVATAQRRADDPEWQARIDAHVARRPVGWTTIETTDLVGVLDADDDSPILIDCLTVWLTRVMDDLGCWPELDGFDTDASARDLGARIDELVDALARTRRDVIAVSNEVGQGVVPATASGRAFRDQMGIVNLRVAGVCDEAWFLVAGCPLRLK